MALGRAQVLRDRDDLAAGLVQVAQRVGDLVRRLAHAEDQVRLGDQPDVAGLRDDLERALVAERGPDPLEDPRDGLQVVREHLGPGVEHRAELVVAGVEVRDQQLDAGARVHLVDLPDGLGVEPGAAVVEVVAGDAGDGRVPQPHLAHGLGDPARLVGVQLGGTAGVDLAEVTAPRALLAADQERGLPVLPALVDVGAPGLLAHRVQTTGADQALELGVLRTGARAGADPGRLALDRGLAVADLEAQELSAFRCDGHGPHGTPRVIARPAPRRTRVTGVTRLRPGRGSHRSPRRWPATGVRPAPGPARRCCGATVRAGRAAPSVRTGRGSRRRAPARRRRPSCGATPSSTGWVSHRSHGVNSDRLQRPAAAGRRSRAAATRSCPGCAATDTTGSPASRSLRSSSAANSRFASFDALYAAFGR